VTVEEDEETTCIRVLRELKPEELELPGVISVEKILELELVGAEVDAVELLELESDEEFVELRLELLVLETDDDFVELIECVVDVPEEENVDALVELEVLDDETEDVSTQNRESVTALQRYMIQNQIYLRKSQFLRSWE